MTLQGESSTKGREKEVNGDQEAEWHCPTPDHHGHYLT